MTVSRNSPHNAPSDAPPDVPWVVTARGVLVTVRLTPKGGRDAIEGLSRLGDGRVVLKARVRAAPHEGAANAALTALLAKALRVPARSISLASGATARIKQFEISGDGAALVSTLETIAVSR